MAAINTVTNIMDGIDLSDDWVDIELESGTHTAYVIAIKEQPIGSETINVEDIVSIMFEIAIETGIEDKFITIKRACPNFNEITSSDEATNKATAFVQLLNLPTKFKIKASAINTKSSVFTTGTTSIDVNLNPLNLGCN